MRTHQYTITSSLPLQNAQQHIFLTYTSLKQCIQLWSWWRLMSSHLLPLLFWTQGRHLYSHKFLVPDGHLDLQPRYLLGIIRKQLHLEVQFLDLLLTLHQRAVVSFQLLACIFQLPDQQLNQICILFLRDVHGTPDLFNQCPVALRLFFYILMESLAWVHKSS